ncbi:hypothetical protein [Urechidicola croceus]|uniref:Uncharacterized protein n=1 Tax=Urechidicola croceus TaxID=1850246 RepID=A0A1D8P996_9FLAO|nr:hypothetical protein [Urechidicola croceus]AOW21119.1 hypothetical protein LPB138_10705 [Urechidicola croceus]
MKKSISFKQDKPVTSIIIGLMLITLAIFSSTVLSQFIIMSLIGVLLLGYKFSYIISEDFKNKKVFSIFGIPIFKSKLELDFPEYISLFGANYSKRNDWGPVAAIGTNSNVDKIAIKLFKGNKNVTVFKSEKYEVSKNLADELSEMLKVELVDNVKN